MEGPKSSTRALYLTPARAAMRKVCEERMRPTRSGGPGSQRAHCQPGNDSEAYEDGKFGAPAKPDDTTSVHKGKGSGGAMAH